jgi:hypothetical protein
MEPMLRNREGHELCADCPLDLLLFHQLVEANLVSCGSLTLPNIAKKTENHHQIPVFLRLLPRFAALVDNNNAVHAAAALRWAEVLFVYPYR